MIKITVDHGVRMTDKEDIKRYVFGGRGKFVLKSGKSEKMYKYKVSKCKKNENLLYISVFNPEIRNYLFIGSLNIINISYLHSKKSKVMFTEESVKGIIWLMNTLKCDKDFPDVMEFHHMGICCCCGRTLEVTDNIQLGIGPVCFKNYGNKRMKKILKLKKIILHTQKLQKVHVEG
jgi:hypothetical protein